MDWYTLENGVKTTLASDITDVATSMTVTSAADFPASYPFLLTLWDPTQGSQPADDADMEVVNVTNVAGAVCTIVRGQDDTSGVAHSAGVRVQLLIAKAVIEHGKSKACFIPTADVIYMPNKTDFKSVPDYYATGLHELTHWTGHKSRLARDFNGRFGDSSYAFEELIAELGAAFLCAHCSIDGQLQHDSYIASWLKVLKNDKRAIFTAAAAARKAAEFLVGSQGQDEEQAAA